MSPFVVYFRDVDRTQVGRAERLRRSFRCEEAERERRQGEYPNASRAEPEL